MNLGLLLFLICFAGTCAVFSHQIDWLIEPALRAGGTGEHVDAAAAVDDGRARRGGVSVAPAFAWLVLVR